MTYDYDVIVIGSGPAGQKAAVQSAKLGKRVALVERDRYLGGACVHRGTIPSKTLRENALRITHLRANAKLSQANFLLTDNFEMGILIDRLDEVLKAHDNYMERQISRNHITRLHGRAAFEDEHHILLTQLRQKPTVISAEKVIIATGSYPRTPDNIPIDHEHIYDSDSILSMLYLPKSLVVLGGGVIASEYASIFQALDVKVTMIDKYPQPLGFLDDDLTKKFVHAFETAGGTWKGNTTVNQVYWDGHHVVTDINGEDNIISDKLLCAAGRIANVADLQLQNIGLTLNERGLISVNEILQTRIPSVYAAGDVIGPPALASTSMEQGRRASCNAFGITMGDMSQLIPTGIYGIPELSCVGLTETAAREKYGEVIVGKAVFEEIARGQISGIQDGMLKIVCDAQGEKVLGVMIVGEGATELIHIGQMAILANATVDIFVESIFNFPTLAEAYRVAALAVIGQRNKHNQGY
ncbi:MAG: Si-specific NAD(P)(+) transhydrogenase [Cellvibrionaceae bacterium]|nr:Si-specific NAD(P)(+) transhydrogenase [Cellvibrionaceae bacterium]